LSYAASGPRALRQNAIWQPLYSLSYFFIILLGFAALVAGTHPPGGNANGALLQFVTDRYPPWVIGLFAGTASLLALVPGSVLLMTCGTIFARNIARPLLGERSPAATLLLSRVAMIGFAALAVYLTLGASGSIVKIGLSAYASIGMLAPGAVLALLWKRSHAFGVLAGMAAGYVALLDPAATALWHGLLPGWEPGLIALILNAAVAIAISLVAKSVRHS
jgi:SSS family solute:Na+ symporter